MRAEGEQGAERTRARTCAPRGRTRMRRAPRFATHGALLLLCACPQLLDDGFYNVANDDITVLGDAGASGQAGVGGGGGVSGGAGGAAAGSSGAAGNAAAGAGGGVPEGLSAVIDSVPVDGALGVLPDIALLFTFNAPMDTASVEAAYSSTKLPAASVSFTWSDGDTVLHVQPNAPLQVASGSNSALVTATSYGVGFAAGGLDKGGHPLAQRQISFSTVRSLTQSLKAVQNRDLTGNWRSDSSYGIVECERVDTTICVGDGALTAEADPAYKALITFDLSSLPSDAISVTAAELSLVLTNVIGTPFSDLGALQLEHVEFSSIGDAAFAVPALSARQLMSSGAALGESVSSVVLADVQRDWDARNYSQYRLTFDTASNDNDAPDQLVCDWNSVLLAVSYWLP